MLGTGARVLPAPKFIRDYISSLGIQLDVMDTVSLRLCDSYIAMATRC